LANGIFETTLPTGTRIPISIEVNNHNLKGEERCKEIDNSKEVHYSHQKVYAEADTFVKSLPPNLSKYLRSTEADTTEMVKKTIGN
jgi:hypothetical protein